MSKKTQYLWKGSKILKAVSAGWPNGNTDKIFRSTYNDFFSLQNKYTKVYWIKLISFFIPE